jgi:hypothetical protein
MERTTRARWLRARDVEGGVALDLSKEDVARGERHPRGDGGQLLDLRPAQARKQLRVVGNAESR